MKKVDFTEKQKFIEGKVFAEGFDLFKKCIGLYNSEWKSITIHLN